MTQTSTIIDDNNFAQNSIPLEPNRRSTMPRNSYDLIRANRKDMEDGEQWSIPRAKMKDSTSNTVLPLTNVDNGILRAVRDARSDRVRDVPATVVVTTSLNDNVNSDNRIRPPIKPNRTRRLCKCLSIGGVLALLLIGLAIGTYFTVLKYLPRRRPIVWTLSGAFADINQNWNAALNSSDSTLYNQYRTSYAEQITNALQQTDCPVTVRVTDFDPYGQFYGDSANVASGSGQVLVVQFEIAAKNSCLSQNQAVQILGNQINWINVIVVDITTTSSSSSISSTTSTITPNSFETDDDLNPLDYSSLPDYGYTVEPGASGEQSTYSQYDYVYGTGFVTVEPAYTSETNNQFSPSWDDQWSTPSQPPETLTLSLWQRDVSHFTSGAEGHNSEMLTSVGDNSSSVEVTEATSLDSTFDREGSGNEHPTDVNNLISEEELLKR